MKSERHDTCVDYLDGCGELAGWYVNTDGAFLELSELRFQDRGNGVECINDHVHGPFRTEEEAQKWLAEFWADDD